MSKTLVSMLAAVAFVVCVPRLADAGSCGGVSMPDSKTVGGEDVVLNGMGIREATMLSVNVYVAGLYVTSKSSDGTKIASSDSPKQLVMQFVRSVSKEKIVNAYRDSFGNLSTGGLSDEIDKFLGWMESVESGDRQILTYVPGHGVTYHYNSNRKGTITSDKFATVLFKIWLGSNPPNAGLKNGLLGGSCG